MCFLRPMRARDFRPGAQTKDLPAEPLPHYVGRNCWSKCHYLYHKSLNSQVAYCNRFKMSLRVQTDYLGELELHLIRRCQKCIDQYPREEP